MFTKFAGLGALGAGAGIAALFAGLVFLTIPQPRTAGINLVTAQVTWIAVGTLVLALVLVHVLFAHRLLRPVPE